MARNTCLTVVGAVLALFGVGVLILGIYVSPKELPSIFREQVDNYVIVDSEVCNVFKCVSQLTV
jgi:hypothetical protein